jgi:hypothetical protein
MPKLFMLLVGCKPAGRHTEQHDVFFGIGESVKQLLPAVNDFWPEVKNNFHIDGWREVTKVDGYRVCVAAKEMDPAGSPLKLFFINLGGYKPGEFEEFHYKLVAAASTKGDAIRAAKKTAFYRHTGFNTAPAHVDDKYGIDVDDAYEIKNILNDASCSSYQIILNTARDEDPEDVVHLGYFTISSFK